MNALDDRRRNPRMETHVEATRRVMAEALERPCPEPGCGALPGEYCLNSLTGLPYRGNTSHFRRVKAVG